MPAGKAEFVFCLESPIKTSLLDTHLTVVGPGRLLKIFSSGCEGFSMFLVAGCSSEKTFILSFTSV